MCLSGDTGDSGDSGVSGNHPNVSEVTKVTKKNKNKKMPTTKNKDGFIPPHGGYRNLISYKKAEIIYDGTVYFCNRFIEKRDRTFDQMVQAARSGKQNIAEASMASGTSKETEIKLTNVARASLEELKIDYEDFLRTRKMELWDKNHRLVNRLR